MMEAQAWRPDLSIAMILTAQRNFAEANSYYSKVLDKFPDHPAVLLRYGYNLKLLNQPVDAERVIKSAIRSQPNNVRAEMKWRGWQDFSLKTIF